MDKNSATVDFLLRAKRDHAAARALCGRAIGLHDVPEKITLDKSGSNKAAIIDIQTDCGNANQGSSLVCDEPVLLAGILIAATFDGALGPIA